MSDELWDHFRLLFPTLGGIGESPVLLAGGYGLFLKQNWLRENPSYRVVVPLDRWEDPAPRTTKDMDFAIGLDLLLEEGKQAEVSEALRRLGFSEKTPKWQWVRRIGDKEVIAELHALPSPEAPPGKAGTDPRLKREGDRIKRKPSPRAGDRTIHGFANDELIGQDLHPFRFEWRSVSITVPNPVTWLVMKLTAASDRWGEAQDPTADPGKRAGNRDLAAKHAGDVYRVVAMMTAEEYETAAGVVAALSNHPVYQGAVRCFQERFAREGSWGSEVAKDKWGPADFEQMRLILSDWFS